jgi:hypothetical protein
MFVFLQYHIFVLILYLLLVNFAFVLYLPYWLTLHQTNGVSKFIRAFCLRVVHERTITQSFNFASFLPFSFSQEGISTLHVCYENYNPRLYILPLFRVSFWD